MPVTNLLFIQQQIIRYGMSIYLILGIVGSVCNCIVFAYHSLRRTASSVYLFALAIFAIIHLIWSISPYLYALNQMDLQTHSLFYCKIRLYGSHVLGQYLRYTIVLACIDRFCVTQTRVHLRSLSSVSTAIKLIFIMMILSLLIAIHVPFFLTLKDGICGMFGIYKLIYALYQIILVGILPPLLMCIFSVLTIRNLNQRHTVQVRAARKDRYLMRMIIAEIGLNLFASMPYSINLIYGAATYYVTNKSIEQVEIESFVSFFTQFHIYLLSVVAFYLFLLISKPFRKEFVKLLTECWNKYIIRRTRIAPLNREHITEKTNELAMHDKH